MAKINIKLDKKFLSELTGSLNKSFLENNKKLLSLFDMVNNHKNDNIIDIKEITDFANSIFTADTNNDGEVDNKELETYIKNHEDTFKKLKLKAKDIMEFLNIFRTSSDKTDEKNDKIINEDGSYSIVYEEDKNNPKSSNDQIKINYDKDNNIISTETTREDKRVIKDKDGNVLTTQWLDGVVVVREHKSDGLTYLYNGNKTTIRDSRGILKEFEILEDGTEKVTMERKSDGLTYHYDGNKTTIKNSRDEILKEIEVLDSGKRIIKEHEKKGFDKTVITTTNEETGEVTKETIYDDGYYVHVDQSSVISLHSIKKIFNQPISSDTYHSINYMGKDIINVLAKEDDKNFQKTYITGMINKIVELANLLSINSDEVKAIKKAIETKGFEKVPIDSISKAYSKLFDKIEKAQPNFKTSRINHGNYESKHSYKKITTTNKIIIIDSDNNKTIIDKNRLLSAYNAHNKEVMWNVIKDLPAEALLDLSVEATFVDEEVGEGIGGDFNQVIDRIRIGNVVDAETILHELGHAVDCKGKGSDNNFQTNHNAKFRQAFQEEMKAYLAAGNKRCVAYYDQKGEYKQKNITLKDAQTDNDSTYATVDEQEMFAECYALLMGGSVQSQEVIEKYFTKTMACVLEMVESTRKLSKSQRHVA